MFKPLHDRVLIQPLDAAEKTPGGLHIPQGARERPIEGKVLAVGPGRRDDKGELHAVTLRVGDIAVFSKYSGTEILVNGERMLVMTEHDVLGIRDA